MKKLFKSAALAATLVCLAPNAFATFAAGAEIDDDLVGTGCTVGTGEYASTTFSLSDGDLVVDHGSLVSGDSITHEVTYSFNTASLVIDPACTGTLVDVTVTEGALVKTDGITNVDVAITGDGTDQALSAMSDIVITFTADLTSDSGDLVEKFSYTQPITVSVAAAASTTGP